MKKPTNVRRTSHLGRTLRTATAILATAALMACTGGGSDDTASTTAKPFSGVVTQYGDGVLTVDGIAVDTSTLGSVPAGLSVGTRVELEGTLDNGVIRATRLELDDDRSDDVPDGIRNELKGTITAMSSPTSFSVNGVPVDATGATALPTGLRVGSLVEVYGILVNGVMQASRVELEINDGIDDDRDDDGTDDDRDDDGTDDDRDDDSIDDRDDCDDDVDPTCRDDD